MSGSTYKWVGGNGPVGDVDDASLAANWDIEANGTFEAAVTPPSSGDTALIDSGTIATPLTGSADIVGVTIQFGGAGATFDVADATLDQGTTITAVAGSSGTIAIGANVTDHATISADGAGASIDISLSSTVINQSVVVAQAGGNVTIGSSDASAFANNGGLVAVAATMDVATAITGFGLLVVGLDQNGDPGQLILAGSVAGSQSLLFTNTDATLTIDDPSGFNAHVLAFQTGDTIDIPGIVASKATLEMPSGSQTLTVTDGTNTVALSFNGAGFTKGEFATTADATGGTDLTITGVTNSNYADEAGSGTFGSSAIWVNGAVPTAASFAVIASLGGGDFTITASGSNPVNSLALLAPTGLLDVTGSLNASRAIFEAVGTIVEAAGASVTAKTFSQLGGGATLTLASGAALTLSGGATIGGGNGNSGLDIEAYASLDNANLTANVSSIRIGWLGSGTVDADNTSDVNANFTDIGASGTATGALTIEDNSVWTDAPTDASAPFPGYMIVGGGVANGTGGFDTGGSGLLVVETGATLTDDSGALVAQSAFSSGTAEVESGALWNDKGNLSVGNVSAAAATFGTLLVNAANLAVGGTLSVVGTLDVTNGAEASAAGLAVQDGTLGVDGTSLLRVGVGTMGASVGLVIEPGATFSLSGGASESATLDLLGTLATAGATINGGLYGSGVIDIASGSTLNVEALGAWTAGVNFAAGGGGDYAVSGPFSDDTGFIGGFGAVANTVDLPGIAYVESMPLNYNPVNGMLTLGSADGFLVGANLQLDLGLDLTYAARPDAVGGTAIVISTATPCYVAGTRIATPGGETAVEALRAGDAVLVQDGAAWVARPVRWVGRFSVDLARHPNPETAAPIRILAGAFADAAPRRDLLVSPDHALLVDGVLVQAQALVNGATIRREPLFGRVDYFHVELDRHGILLAEGLPAESYLDTGNRGQFAAEPGQRKLFPDLAAPRTWHADACAPLVLQGPLLAAAHARLLARAESLGHCRTGDPGLTVLADGIAVPLRIANDGVVTAKLPAGAAKLRLRSRWFVPNAFNPAAGDGRRLGIAVAGLHINGVAPKQAAYGAGWHAAEPAWRWTDGEAELALPPRRRASVLTLRVVQAAPAYWAAAA